MGFFSDRSKLQLFNDGFYFVSPQIHIQLAILFNILQHNFFWLVDYSTDLYNPISHWFTQDSDFEWQEQVVDFCTHFFTKAIHIRHAKKSNSFHINHQCQFDYKHVHVNVLCFHALTNTCICIMGSCFNKVIHLKSPFPEHCHGNRNIKIDETNHISNLYPYFLS